MKNDGLILIKFNCWPNGEPSTFIKDAVLINT